MFSNFWDESKQMFAKWLNELQTHTNTTFKYTICYLVNEFKGIAESVVWKKTKQCSIFVPTLFDIVHGT